MTILRPLPPGERVGSWLSRSLVLAALVGGMVVVAAGSYALASGPQATAAAVNSSSCDGAKSNSALKLCVAAELKGERALMTETAARAERYFAKALVTKAQASFQRYADSECLVAASLHAGGSEYPLLVSRCELKLTTGRVQQLEGDITGAAQA